MSIKTHIAGLNRFGNRQSAQWKKLEEAIRQIAEQILVPLCATGNECVRLPWGYRFTVRDSGTLWWIQKYDRENLVFEISSKAIRCQHIIEFSRDIYLGWLDEVEKFVQERLKANLNE